MKLGYALVTGILAFIPLWTQGALSVSAFNIVTSGTGTNGSLSVAGTLSPVENYRSTSGSWVVSDIEFALLVGGTVLPVLPTVDVQPSNATLVVGQNLLLSATASGTPPFSYQWRKGGISISGATDASFTIAGVMTVDAGNYDVAVGNFAGSVTSSVVTLTVNEATAPNPPPQLTGMAMSNGWFRFILNGPVCTIYVIQVSSNLFNWSAISTNTIPASGMLALIDPSTVNKPQLFYRAMPFGGTSAVAGEVIAWGENNFGETNVPASLTNAMAVAGGVYHGLALRLDGTVIGWGENDFGQTNPPVGLSNVIAVAAGWGSSLALKCDGTLEEWGWDGGYGLFSTAHALSNITAVAATWDCLMALKSDSTPLVWGKSTHGETNIPSGLASMVAIAGGGYHCMALRSDGTVVVWGDNGYNQTNVPAGLNNVMAIAAGGGHCLARKADGTVIAWGNNSAGQTNVPAGLTNVTAISAGTSHSLALKADGTVVVWGDNSFGQTNAPVNLTNVFSISAGGFHSLVITNR